jgi:hypothetical protein
VVGRYRIRAWLERWARAAGALLLPPERDSDAANWRDCWFPCNAAVPFIDCALSLARGAAAPRTSTQSAAFPCMRERRRSLPETLASRA